MMIATRSALRVLTSTLVLFAAVAPMSAQGSLATGRADPNAIRGQAEYMAYMSASVDTVLKAWERATKARDANALAGLYTTDAIIALSSGRLVQGRGSVRDAYERMLPRMHAARIEVAQIVASANVASVVAHLECDVQLPNGGWYHKDMLMLLTIKAEDRGRFRIAIQSGGDFQVLSPAKPRSGVPGAVPKDSLECDPHRRIRARSAGSPRELPGRARSRSGRSGGGGDRRERPCRQPPGRHVAG